MTPERHPRVLCLRIAARVRERLLRDAVDGGGALGGGRRIQALDDDLYGNTRQPAEVGEQLRQGYVESQLVERGGAQAAGEVPVPK